MSTIPSLDAFIIERHGDVTLICVTPALESIDASLEQQITDAIMAPLHGQASPQVVFDLTEVSYFGSMFLAVLLRSWKYVAARGGMMALAGVSSHARELLRLTSLDMIWAMYPTRSEAIEALSAD